MGLELYDVGNGFQLYLKYSSDVLGADLIVGMMEDYCRLLGEVTTDEKLRIGDLSIFNSAERENVFIASQGA
jgi:hypothetical protein